MTTDFAEDEGVEDVAPLDDSNRRMEYALTLPTHPDHDLSCEPDGQPEYANPVTLNNYEIVYANAMIQITARVITLNKMVEQKKKALRDIERTLDDMGSKLLRQYPPRANDVKTLKLQEAYLQAKAYESGNGDLYDSLIARSRVLEDEVASLVSRVKNAEKWVATITEASDKIKTHLSFVKDEARRSGFRG